MHFTEGSYARIAAKLFKELDVDIYYVRPRGSFHLSRSSRHITTDIYRDSWSTIHHVLGISRR